MCVKLFWGFEKHFRNKKKPYLTVPTTGDKTMMRSYNCPQ